MLNLFHDKVSDIRWYDLSSEEERAIRDPEDYPVISFIDGIPHDGNEGLRKKVYSSIIFKQRYRKEYMDMQERWICDFEEYWGIDHHRNPLGSREFGNDLVNGAQYERFRLYFATKFPYKMKIRKRSPEVRKFFRQAKIVRKSIE